MIFVRGREVDDPGFDGDFVEVVGVEILNDVFVAKDFAVNPALFSRVREEGFDVKAVWLPSMTNPVLSLQGDEYRPGTLMNVTSVYSIMKKAFDSKTGELPSDVMTQITEVMKKKAPQTFARIMAVCLAQLKWEEFREADVPFSISGADAPHVLPPTP